MVLGISPGSGPETIRKAWREKIGKAHPDQGGSDTAAAELNRARDEALAISKA